MEPMETAPKTLTETLKETVPDRKNLEKGALAENGKENGDGLPMGVKEESFDKKINSLGEGLEVSEMNGVCSLLKMQKGENLKGLDSVLDFIDQNQKLGCGDIISESRNLAEGANGVESPDVKEGYEGGHEFNVGDFVWGKIRSHPWWPGRVYDPLDASEHANKIKQKDKILVAYFGDGTFAWCVPSQLKPFEENFVEMSMQSSSKNFVNAVDVAVNEVGRLVDLKMTCSCVAKGDLIGFGRTLAVNAGIKDGLLVPEYGIEKFSPTLYDPAGVLPALKCIAQVAAVTDLLEFSVMKKWLAAFYRAKGGYQLPIYGEPQPVPGLDDGSQNQGVYLTNYSNGMEVTMQGAVEDWHSPPSGSKLGETPEGVAQKGNVISEDGQHHNRKQKSIAEILGGELNAVAQKREDSVAKKERKSSKPTSSARKKTRKSMSPGGDIEADSNREEQEVAKVGVNSEETAPSGRRKKKKSGDEPLSEVKNKMEDVIVAGMISDKLASNSGRKKRKAIDEAVAESKNNDGNVTKEGAISEKPGSSSGGGEGKVSDGAVTGSINNVGNVTKGANSEKPPASSRGRKKKVLDVSKVSDEAVAADKNNVEDVTKEGANSEKPPASSRGRKKKVLDVSKVSDEAVAVDKNNVEDVTKEGANSEKPPASSRGRKKKVLDVSKVSGEAVAVDKNNVEDVTKEGASSEKPPASSRGRKKKVLDVSKVGDEAVAVDKNNVEDVTKEGANSEKPASSTRGRKKKASESVDNNSDPVSTPKVKKVKNVSESLGAAEEKVSSLDIDGADETSGSASTGTKKPTSIDDNDDAGGDEGMKDNTGCEEKETEKGFLSRERKKSKYLSPPYVNLSRVARYKETDAEPQIVSTEAQLEEKVTAADSSDKSDPQVPKQDETMIDPLKVKVAADVLSEIRSVALDPTNLTRSTSLDTVDFYSAFRNYFSSSSNYLTEYQPEKESELQDSESSPLIKKRQQIDSVSDDQQSLSKKIRNSEKESDEKLQTAALFVTFSPGSSLPSKNDLIIMYEKFGALNKEETNIVNSTRRAAVVFLRSAEAEEAFNSSQLASPFGTAKVTFQLQYHSAESKKIPDRKPRGRKPKLSSANDGAKTPDQPPPASTPSAIDVSQLKDVRQKLESLSSLLEKTSDGEISRGLKSKLEVEMKLLLEKVNTMV